MTLRVRLRPPLAVVTSLILMVLILFALAPAMAEEASGRKRIDDLAARITNELTLDTAQQKAVRKVMREFGQSMRQVMHKHGIDPANGNRPPLHKMLAARSDMSKARTKMESSMAEILTPQQMRRLRTLQKQQRAKWMSSHQRP